MVARLLLLGLQGLSTAREEKGCGIGGEHSASRAWWMLSLYEMFERDRIVLFAFEEEKEDRVGVGEVGRCEVRE
jgi:hypothetical protein